MHICQLNEIKYNKLKNELINLLKKFFTSLDDK